MNTVRRDQNPWLITLSKWGTQLHIKNGISDALNRTNNSFFIPISRQFDVKTSWVLVLVLIGQKSRKHFGNFDKDDTTLDLDLRDLDKETVHQKTAGHDTF